MRFIFGLDKDRVIEQFDAIAEGLKSGNILPQGVSYAEEQTHEDFVTRTVTLKFAIKQEDKDGQG